MADCPDGRRLHNIPEAFIQLRVEGRQSLKHIFSILHRCGAGMVLLTRQRHAHIPNTDNIADDADPVFRCVEIGTLFDMHFNIAAELRRVDRTSDTIRQNLPHLAKAVARFVSQRVSRVSWQMTGPHSAACRDAKAPFLILKIDHRDGWAAPFTRSAGHFQSRHDTQCPVKPPAFGLAVGVRSQQQAAARCNTKLVAHRVHSQCQARFRDLAADPVACRKFIWYESRSHNAFTMPAGTKAAQFMQRLQKAVRIDLNH